MWVLVVNSGSSSLKLRVLGDSDELLGSSDLGADAVSSAGELSAAMAALPVPDAIGHRVVHGGSRFRDAVRIDAGVERAMAELTDLAPLHQPRALVAVAAFRDLLPAVPAVACFDTAFHSTLPLAASTYAVPREWRADHGIRKYGFHGLSHAYVGQHVSELAGVPVDSLRVVSCHLGAGASATAIDHGVSVETTMGFTPLDGLVMATRSGSVDAGMVLWLQQQRGLSAVELADALTHRSGVLALAGTSDLREVVARAANGDPSAELALDVYCHRLRAGIAAMAAAMGGLDALVFTGGVGENSPPVRARTAAGLAFLGVGLDPVRNEAARRDSEIGAATATVRTFVIAAREDLQIARDVRRVLAVTA